MTTHNSSNKKIIIVGGGFAGISLARHLNSDRRFDIHVVSDSDQFKYYPALYRSATGHTNIESSIPMPFMLFDKPRISFTKQKVTSIDSKNHVMRTEDGQELHYDIGVLALGVVTSYFNIDGLEKYSYGIKSIEDVTELRRHLHDELIQTGRLDRRYVVVGAGPTGVELSASLVSYLRRTARFHGLKHDKITIDLIEAAPRILPRMSKRAAALVERRLTKLGVNIMTGKTVQSESPTSLTVDGRSLPTETVIWTAGVSNNPFFANNAAEFTFDAHHKVIVDDYLQAAPDVYVLGDNAATTYGGLAQTAVTDGAYLARQLRRTADKQQPQAYRAKRPVVVIPAGEGWSIVEYGNFVLAGWLGSLLRKAADFIGYKDVTPFFMALTLWLADRSLQEECDICRTAN